MGFLIKIKVLCVLDIHISTTFPKTRKPLILGDFLGFLLFPFRFFYAILHFALKNNNIGDKMTHLTVSSKQGLDYTILSNRFIDEYMIQANEAQVKIYLYLLRMTGANLPFGISDIADQFNYTEQDVLRSLCYWEKKNLLTLDFDSNHNLKAIHILSIPAIDQESVSAPTSGVSITATPQAEIVPLAPKLAISNVTSSSTSITVPEKPHYSSSDLVAFKSNEETAQIIFVAEQYTGKPLSAADLQMLLYIYDGLNFSTDLIDYLIQYCVGRGKKSFSYIQKVAINWADSNVTTIEEAKNHTGRYEKSVYTIMKALGKNTDPTEPEISFIRKWTNEYGFSLDIILMACERCVLSTDKHRFEYTNAILTNWHTANVKTPKDIEAIEANRPTSPKPGKAGGNGNNSSNGSNIGFDGFSQREYDYDALEKALLGAQ